MKNYVGTDDWLGCYIRGRCSQVCHIKQGRKTHALQGINWYHRMYNIIAKVLHKPRSV